MILNGRIVFIIVNYASLVKEKLSSAAKSLDKKTPLC